MPQYRATSDSAIREIWTQEGDSLLHFDRFKAPDLSQPPEEFRESLARAATQDLKPEVING